MGLEKNIYLIRGGKSEQYAQFQKRILVLLENLTKEKDVKSISVVITVQKPPGISVIPFKRKKIASISVKSEKRLIIDQLTRIDGFAGLYRVEEAIPIGYEKTWNDREPSPGVNLFTLFRKKRSITYETFIDRWHNRHTPLSLKLHPLWNYNRNVVLDVVIDQAEHWDGIVEEHFQKASDLLNPARFFGNTFTMIYHMLEVFIDTRSFLDYKTIETYLAQEYHIKSLQD